MLPDGNGLKILEELKSQNKQDGVIIIQKRIRSSDLFYRKQKQSDFQQHLKKKFYDAGCDQYLKQFTELATNGKFLKLQLI